MSDLKKMLSCSYTLGVVARKKILAKVNSVSEAMYSEAPLTRTTKTGLNSKSVLLSSGLNSGEFLLLSGLKSGAFLLSRGIIAERSYYHVALIAERS